MKCFGSNLFFYNLRTTNNYEKHGHPLVQQSFLELCTKFKANRQVILVLALGEHENL